MIVWPLKFREVNADKFIVADDAGGWFWSDREFINRYAHDSLSTSDIKFLKARGHAYQNQEDAAFHSFCFRYSQRQCSPQSLSYVILIPTLRCNLECSYCQVSRAAENSRGYDWTEDTVGKVINILDRIESTSIKIEFQGGEPLLRIDLLEKVRSFCRSRFASSSFVVCTNLQSLGEREWAFLSDKDTFVSTSLDGTDAIHQRQRTGDTTQTERFKSNLRRAISSIGPDRVAALPTVDPRLPPDFEDLVSSYESAGFDSIFLRPINYQGFARRRLPRKGDSSDWTRYHSDFIDFLIQRNHKTNHFLQEYYFSLCLRRVLRSDENRNVDLRNPNFLGKDYVVIDYDGKIYPTDEARMLARIGMVDLSIGDVSEGLNDHKISSLNANSLNNFDPDCIHCPYQAYCGTDIVDAISRHGHADVPRPDTWFCQRHTAIFDKVFELLSCDDEATRRSIAAWTGTAEWHPDTGAFHQ